MPKDSKVGVEDYSSYYANKYNGTMFRVSDTNIESKLINKINGSTKKTYKTGFSSSFNSTPITIDWLKAYNGEIKDLSMFLDSDGDGLYDFQEVNFKSGLMQFAQDGSVILPSLEQIVALNPRSKNGLEKLMLENSDIKSLLKEVLILLLTSRPDDVDSDGDGLLEGSRIYIDSKIVAPKDPNPLKVDGPKNAWKTHIAQIKSGQNVATDYSSEYYKPMKIEAEIKTLWGIIPYLDSNLWEAGYSVESAIGSRLLDFKMDDKNIALHSDSTQWQSVFGYNDFYDVVFNMASNMERLKLNFDLNGQEYIVWAWKGDYLNLGVGSEVGFYKKNNLIDKIPGLEHWMVENEFPMTLSLYKKTGNGIYENHYSWLPRLNQWWITGFVPNIYKYTINANELLQVASIDFSSEPNMYSSLKSGYESDPDYKKIIIFDDEKNTIWLLW